MKSESRDLQDRVNGVKCGGAARLKETVATDLRSKSAEKLFARKSFANICGESGTLQSLT